MVKRIELGTSYIIPKGLLGFYIKLARKNAESLAKHSLQCYIRRIREIRSILTNRAVKRPIYAYVES